MPIKYAKYKALTAANNIESFRYRIENVIHFSSLLWINFTSILHARHYAFNNSTPKISFGKMEETDGRKKMPVSVHVHHALMDGYHLGQYFDELKQLLE